ncbi:tetratricopeptide repeat-containing protein [Defluviicoccus vanus]|uniref:Uncharacterized protein n=1 Tax=Defluviicoccus vanus TaxID=111831 RepID=A0A7H1N4B0_9PROT|nr:tetratricopeptide repeat-containing protein [Defluviicoccus vanus]QNT70546.1 hypothetical protein HQ394_15945 [Defluviicoccus vanus]
MRSALRTAPRNHQRYGNARSLGAVHKRLWEKARDEVALDKAIRSYERGFYLCNDYYNGINFAFLLNIRAAHALDLARTSADPSSVALRRAAAIADFVQARRVREEVVSICERWLDANPAPEAETAIGAKVQYLKSKYWVLASMAEAYLGMGQDAKAEEVYTVVYSIAPESWMVTTSREQRAKLAALLADPPLKYITVVDALHRSVGEAAASA